MKKEFFFFVSLNLLFSSLFGQLIYVKCQGWDCGNLSNVGYSKTLFAAVDANTNNSIALLDYSLHVFDSAGIEPVSKRIVPDYFTIIDTSGGALYYINRQSQILQVSPNLFIVAGFMGSHHTNPDLIYPSNIFLMGLDSTFNTLWSNSYRFDSTITISENDKIKLINNPDSISFTLGIVNTDSAGNFRNLLLDINYAGNVIHSFKYVDPVSNFYMADFCNGSDGFIYCVLRNNTKTGVLKLDSTLQIINARYFDHPGNSTALFISPVSTFMNVGLINDAGFLRFLVDSSLTASSIYKLSSDTNFTYSFAIPENNKTILLTDIQINLAWPYYFSQENFISIDTSATIIYKDVNYKGVGSNNSHIIYTYYNGYPLKNKSGYINCAAFSADWDYGPMYTDGNYFLQRDSLLRSCGGGSSGQPNYYLQPDSLRSSIATINQYQINVTVTQDTLTYINSSGFASEECSEVLGINKIENEDGTIKVFPNPSNETINYENNLYDELLIFNTSSKLCKYVKLNTSGSIDVTELNAGIYYFSFQNNKSVLTKKIVIIK